MNKGNLSEFEAGLKVAWKALRNRLFFAYATRSCGPARPGPARPPARPRPAPPPARPRPGPPPLAVPGFPAAPQDHNFDLKLYFFLINLFET